MKRVLLSLIVLLPMVASAEEVEINGLWYDVITKGQIAKVIKYKTDAYTGDVVIPETIEHNGVSCQVTEIGNQAFASCRTLTSVSIPRSITTIEASAFVNCFALKSVYISDLKAWCGIQFANAQSSPFYTKRCDLYLNGEEIKDLVIPSGVTTIEKYAFYNAKITSVTISEGVTKIADSAFDNCESLTSVTIAPSVTEIGNSAFQYCRALTAVNISDIASWCNIKFNDNPVMLAGHLYLNGEEVKNVGVPEGVTSIGNTFPNCKELTSESCPIA